MGPLRKAMLWRPLFLLVVVVLTTSGLEYGKDTRDLTPGQQAAQGRGKKEQLLSATSLLEIDVQVLKDVGEGKGDGAEGGDKEAEDDADCAETLSCKVGKGLKGHDGKAKNGTYTGRTVNVKQIDEEEKAMQDSKNKMAEAYQKLLANKGDGKGSGAGNNTNEQAEKANQIVSKDEERMQMKENAKNKYEEAKEAAKEKSEKGLKKSQEASEKAMEEKNSKSMQAAAKQAGAPMTKEGLIQKAAEDRFAAYKLKMAAAEVQHQFANSNATKKDVDRAAAAAQAALTNAEATQEKAIMRSLSRKERDESKNEAEEKKRQQARKDEAAGTPKGAAANNGNQQAQNGSGPEQASANQGPNAQQNAQQNGPPATKGASSAGSNSAEATEDDDEPETKPNPVCSKEQCEKKCKTKLCYKYCIRCLKIKSEEVVFRPGVGLVTAEKRAVHHTIDPVIAHALWMNESMRHLHSLEKRDADADTFANGEVMSVFCTHCKDMCLKQHEGYPERIQACDKVCTDSVACNEETGVKEVESDPTMPFMLDSADAIDLTRPQAEFAENHPAGEVTADGDPVKYMQKFCEDCDERCTTPTCVAWCRKKFCEVSSKGAQAPQQQPNGTQQQPNATQQQTNATQQQTNATQQQTNATQQQTNATQQQPNSQPQQQQQQQPNGQPPQQQQPNGQQQQPNGQPPQQQQPNGQPPQQQQQPQQAIQSAGTEHPLKEIAAAAAAGGTVHVIKLPTVTVEKVVTGVPGGASNEQEEKEKVTHEIKEKIMEKASSITDRPAGR